jgi:hypothetical protein
MLKLLTNIVEQLDVALDHLKLGDANNGRFALMLTDNVIEIVLHQLAKDTQWNLKEYRHLDEKFEHTAALERALGQHFGPKVGFAKLIGKLGEETAGSISICHELRNQVYHIGVRHEAILPDVAGFYFHVACQFLASYQPENLWWSSTLRLPERAKKYFTVDKWSPPRWEEFQSACLTMAATNGFKPEAVIEALYDHLAEVIEGQDSNVETIADGTGNQRQPRDVAIMELQIWSMAFSDEGREFCEKRNWPGGNQFDRVQWIRDNFTFKQRTDPIPGWRKRAASLEREKNPHTALKKYRDFMDQTAQLRELFEEAAMGIEHQIDMQIQATRGN